MNESIFSIAEAQGSPELRQVGRNMIKGEVSFAEFEYRNMKTGKRSWMAYAPVPLNGWSLSIVFPVDEFMADAYRLRNIIIGIGLGGGAILILIIVLISQSITLPRAEAHPRCRDFCPWQIRTSLPVIKSKDEIGRLNSAFHYMQDTLNKTIGDLKDASENLKISNTKLEEYSHKLEEKVDQRDRFPKSCPGTAGPIRENGFPGTTHRRNCPRNKKPVEFRQ